MFNRFLRAIFKTTIALISRTVVLGRDNLPQSGPYIMAINHLSYFDLPFTFGEVGGEGVSGWAAEKYQRHPLFGPMLKLAGGIFIERGQVDRNAIARAIDWLNQGKIFGMAPEGTRSNTKALARGKTGAAYLAHEANVPLIPIGIHGTEEAWSSWRRLRRPTFFMHIGAPFFLSPLVDPDQRHVRLRKDTDEIMCRIAALIPAQYHGHYANHPRLQELLADQPRATT
jgi:1-acyl-sn-glycerol-3-phosphate acyltransferase